MYADNEPLQLGDSYYPLDIMQGSKIMDEADVIEGTDQVLEDPGTRPVVLPGDRHVLPYDVDAR